jgi:hypothetical protein
MVALKNGLRCSKDYFFVCDYASPESESKIKGLTLNKRGTVLFSRNKYSVVFENYFPRNKYEMDR